MVEAEKKGGLAMTLVVVLYAISSAWEHFAPLSPAPTMLECNRGTCEPARIQLDWATPAARGRNCPRNTVPVPYDDGEICLPPDAAQDYLRALREASGAP